MTSFFKIFATPLGYLLSFIYDVVSQYGFTIIIFTIIVRLCLFPLYAHQMKGSQRMKEMQPKQKAIQQKFAHDKQEMQRRLMEFYKEEGYNPMSGCLPLLIQMPILMGLFMLLRNPGVYLGGDAKMVMAAHEGFFWINDLGTPDPWILPIVAGLTTFATYSVSQMGMGSMPGQENQTQGMMKIMKYDFPIMIFWMAKTFPAGLALYWATGNFFMMGQSRIMHVWMNRGKEKGKGRKKGEGGKKKWKLLKK
jgi:YidC/Oxa1 family membrane protein insertase